MNLVELRKKHIAWNIEQNPTEITINRTEKVKVGGGFDEVLSTAGPFTVRIYAKSAKTGQEVSTLAGTKHVNTSWSMLADHNTDIRAGSNVKDEFTTVGLDKFQIISIRPQIVNNVIVGYQAELERVS